MPPSRRWTRWPSPSSRRAWIEIISVGTVPLGSAVALLAEGVDRNIADQNEALEVVVALLAEGVDRNIAPARYALWSAVALLAEGVDRNNPRACEIIIHHVALLAEGVDRNRVERLRHRHPSWSPSSRRAWIEMVIATMAPIRGLVALLAEGVDRNRLLAVI